MSKSNFRRSSFGVRSCGFTLIELMIAMVVFLVVAGAAFTAFNQHVGLITHQQNLSAVNIGLRNAMAQMQMDLQGAGQNLLADAPGDQFSLGAVILNDAPTDPGVAPCTVGANYAYPTSGTWPGTACFDFLTIPQPRSWTCSATAGGPPYTYNGTAPMLTITKMSGANLGASATIGATDPNSRSNNVQDAQCFKNNDELLAVQFGGSCNPFCLTTITLTQDATANGTADISLQHSTGGSAQDPQGMVQGFSAGANSKLTTAVTSGWLIDLGQAGNPIKYSVQPNPADASDTQLQRCDANGCVVLADQIIGFKLGAALWNTSANGAQSISDVGNLYYDASQYCNGTVDDCDPPVADDPYDSTLVRAIRVSLIGRTRPFDDAAMKNFTNGFDNGPYLIQQASAMVDLRNLSMDDYGQ